MIDFSSFKVSDYAAWWGAIVASLALIWNIVVAIRTGPKIHLTVTPNMQLHPRLPGEEDKSYIFVKAVNTGTSPTTITHFMVTKRRVDLTIFAKNINHSLWVIVDVLPLRH